MRLCVDNHTWSSFCGGGTWVEEFISLCAIYVRGHQVMARNLTRQGATLVPDLPCEDEAANAGAQLFEGGLWEGQEGAEHLYCNLKLVKAKDGCLVQYGRAFLDVAVHGGVHLNHGQLLLEARVILQHVDNEANRERELRSGQAQHR